MLFDDFNELTKLAKAYKTVTLNVDKANDLFSMADIIEFTKLFGIPFKDQDIPEDLVDAIMDDPDTFVKSARKLSKEGKQLLCDIWIGCQEVAIAKFLNDHGVKINSNDIHRANNVYEFKQNTPGKIEFKVKIPPELMAEFTGKNDKPEDGDEEAGDKPEEKPSDEEKTEECIKLDPNDPHFNESIRQIIEAGKLDKLKKFAKGVGKAAKATAKVAGKALKKGGKAAGKAIKKGVDAVGLNDYELDDKTKRAIYNSFNLEDVLPGEYTKTAQIAYKQNKASFLLYISKVVLASSIKPTGDINGGAITGKVGIFERDDFDGPTLEGTAQLK